MDECDDLIYEIAKGVDTVEYLTILDERGLIEDLSGQYVKIHCRDSPVSTTKLDELTTANGRAIIVQNIRTRNLSAIDTTTLFVDALEASFNEGDVLRFGSLEVELAQSVALGATEIKTKPLKAQIASNLLAGSGTIKLTWPGSVTGAFTWKTAGFDVMITPTGTERKPVITGRVVLKQVFTRGA